MAESQPEHFDPYNDLLNKARKEHEVRDLEADETVYGAEVRYDAGRGLWQVSEQGQPQGMVYDVVKFVTRFGSHGTELTQEVIEHQLKQGQLVVELKEVEGRDPGKHLFEARFADLSLAQFDAA